MASIFFQLKLQEATWTGSDVTGRRRKEVRNQSHLSGKKEGTLNKDGRTSVNQSESVRVRSGKEG